MRRIGCLLLEAPAPPLDPAVQRGLLEVGLAHSPRVENAGPGVVYVDLTGLRSIFGEEGEIGQRLRGAAAARGLSVRVGIGRSRACARLAARGGTGVTVVPAGAEAAHLTSAPLALLECSPETAALLARWGLKTLGDLAALSAASLHERLGAEGLRLHELARGEDPRPLLTWEPSRVLEESMELDGEVEILEMLMEAVERLAGRISAGLEGERLDADRIEWRCRLADRRQHGGEIVPAVPTREPAAITALVRASLELRPPPAAVAAITLRAHPVRRLLRQASLTDPARPSPRALAEILGKLAALVGSSEVGIPVLLDTHRPDAVTLTALPEPRPSSPASWREDTRGWSEAAGQARGLALRRQRPPRPAAVRLTGGRPVQMRSHRVAGPIVTSVGPWRSSGEWWLESRWLSDEWDVELADGTLCRLAHDGSAWTLEGIYD